MWGNFEPPQLKVLSRDFPDGPLVKTLPCNAGGVCLIPNREAKIPHASGAKNQNVKQKQYHNKFNTDFKDGPYKKLKKYYSKKMLSPKLYIEKMIRSL